jgi:hypothetical protein
MEPVLCWGEVCHYLTSRYFLSNASTRVASRFIFTLENLGRTPTSTQRPTKPTKSIHHAIEAPKIKGGNDMANPTRNKGKNNCKLNVFFLLFDPEL